MFRDATSANPDTSNWDVSNVTSMYAMFLNALVANPDVLNWNVSSVTNMAFMFQGSNLSVENLTSIYENWSQLTLQQNVSFSAGTTKYNFSGQAGRDILVNTYNWTITDGGVTSVPFIIEVDTTKAGVSNSDQFQFTGAEGDYDVVAKQNDIVVATFNDLSNQETITLPSSGIYDLEVIPKSSNGFNRIAFDNGGDKDKIIDIKNWGDIVWSTFERAFFDCKNMLVTATDVPNLSSVTDMGFMFSFASSANPDTSNWDVSNVINMSVMFRSASSANPDVSNWDVSSVTNMKNMFRSATSANPDTSNWDVSNVTNISRMFQNISYANPDVSNWDTSNVVGVFNIFDNTDAANPDVRNWNVEGISRFTNAFTGSNLSAENLTAIYENWSTQNVKQNVVFDAPDTQYFESGQAGKDILVNTYNWVITDGGQV